MDRRKFLTGITSAAGATAGLTSSLGAAQAPKATEKSTHGTKETRFVDWHVKGFYCVTCAVGLETMLKGLKGVTRASAEWPSGHTTIGFDQGQVTEKTLREFIAKCGFSVA
jgi:Cu+-exporting ATPase